MNTEFAPGVKMHHATRAKAQKLFEMLVAEYPRLTLEAQTEEDDEGNERATGFVVTHDEAEEPIYEGQKVPSLAELLDTCADQELDPSAQDEDEPEVSGSVVPEHYRQQYRAASSNGQTCGDWLAEWLVAQTNGANGFNVEDFTAICVANDLDMSRGWALLPTSGQPGWVGRYRMNGRQVLEKSVARNGLVRDAMGNAHYPTEAFLATIRTKHEKWLAKQAKAEAAALATIGIETQPEA